MPVIGGRGSGGCLKLLIGCALITWLGEQTDAHGRLLEPPSRSSMWRLGYKTPPNYQDNELFCGGFQNQWETHSGKCGICGDPWQGPRDNEAGGKYARGIITRQYRTGSQVPVIVQITAPHRGWFEFRLCKNDDVTKPATQACLDEHVLGVLNETGSRYHVHFDYPLDYAILVQLPAGLTCTQCVFQWLYNAGNSWGVDDEGTGCVGCGPQEQFRGCSDIAIGDDFTSDDLMPEHKYTPITSVTRTQREEGAKNQDGGNAIQDGDYIDFKNAVNEIKKTWPDKHNKAKDTSDEDKDKEARILLSTLFQNKTNITTGTLYIPLLCSLLTLFVWKEYLS